jgi:hypothetical protein
MALNVAGEEVVFYYDEIHGLTSERERGGIKNAPVAP